MERLFLVSVMIIMCSAHDDEAHLLFDGPQDLSGKMFTFPAESDTAYVTLTPSRESFSAVTVCLRYFIDVKRNISLFSMSLPANTNGFLIFKAPGEGIELLTNNVGDYSQGLPDEQNTWMSLCGTWSSQTGLNQVWVNGKQGVQKLGYTGGQLTGTPIIIVGQEQDSYRGGFEKGQSFEGSLSDIHMWDYVLSPSQILRFSNDQYFTPGNVLNWRALTFTLNGLVILDDKLEPYE